MEKFKQIKTYSPFKIHLSYWVNTEIIPLASFEVLKHNKIAHLIASDADEYNLVIIDENNDGYAAVNPVNHLTRELVKVLKDLPLDAKNAKPIEFIETINDIKDA